MTKRTLIQPAAFMAISLMLFQAFHANAQTDLKHESNAPSFNFSYRIAGDRAAAPLQAFDDGKKTHLQFRKLNSVPAMFADTPAGKILLKEGSDYVIHPPFVVLHKIEPEIMLVMNRRRAFVSYKGQPVDAIVQTPAMYGAKQPMTINGSVRPPEAAEALASRPDTPPKPIAATASSNDIVPLASSLSAGETVVPVTPAKNAQQNDAPTAASEVQQMQPVPAQEWKITATDKSVRHLLERWGKAAGWAVSWEVPRKVPTSFEATFSGTFDVAVDKLMHALRGSDYPLIGCLYEENKVVRVLRRGEVRKCYE